MGGNLGDILDEEDSQLASLERQTALDGNLDIGLDPQPGARATADGAACGR
jgi:hypothetical protein